MRCRDFEYLTLALPVASRSSRRHSRGPHVCRGRRRLEMFIYPFYFLGLCGTRDADLLLALVFVSFYVVQQGDVVLLLVAFLVAVTLKYICEAVNR